MSENRGDTSRRDFMKAGGAATTAAVAGATLGGGAAQAHTTKINALDPTPEQIQEFLALPGDGPVVMLNLLKFKPGGAGEYMQYGMKIQPILREHGARVLFSGQAQHCLIGQADWDMVALVEYPSRQSLITMTSSDAYQAIHHHREAGLDGQVLYALTQNPVPGA